MAYYTGNASSFTELHTALINACISEGWSWSDGILSKNSIYVRPFVRSVDDFSAGQRYGAGLIIQGGTGKNGSNLLNPSPAKPRLGRSGNNDALAPIIIWPAQYHIHLFDTEVYLVLKFNVHYYYRLAFGVSNIQGAGIWVAAYAPEWLEITTGVQYNGFDMTHNSGATGSIGRVTAPFWRSSRSTAAYVNADTIFYEGAWRGDVSNVDTAGFIYAHKAIEPLYSLKNPWNSECILLPFQCYMRRDSAKNSLLVDLVHARLLRIDNYEPEQIISLGSTQWKIYPFLRKNIQQADVGSGDHSGTFGWAIRYDGP